MTAPRVGVPVPVVYGGIAAIIVLLVAVGYFAGRASTGGASAPATVGEARSAGRVEAPATVAPPEPAAATPAVAAPPPVAAAPVPGVAPAGAASPAAGGPPPALRREVAEYFRRMDATQSAAKTWSDPDALAQEVLAQALRGDSGGFDTLVASTRTARDGVRAIAAPTPCAEHHRLTLLLLDEAVVIVSRLRDGVASGDTAAVAAIATSGSALESRARAVDALAASLRAQYGVEAAP